MTVRSARVGTNVKMTEVCAAMGIANLEHVECGIAANREAAHRYRDGLDKVEGVRLYWHPERCRSNWQGVVAEIGPERGCTRDEMLAALRAEGVLARRYIWPGCQHGAV